MAYTPSTAPATDDPKALLLWVEGELVAISRALQETVALELRTRFAEPERPRTGMLVYADGTSWNPGGGEGLYVFDSTGTWKLVTVS